MKSMSIAGVGGRKRLECRTGFALLLLSCALASGCHSLPDQQIRRSGYLTVEGAPLYLQVRGENREAPVLLWLHGGPGGPERPLFRYFNGDLENHFVVAYWDQRGAGRSFDPKADPHRLTVSRHLADMDAVVDHLRQISGRDKIVLIGHSWGATLGLLYVQRHPEKISAFIGVAPLISLLRAQQAEYHFISTEAARRKDEATLAHMRELGPPPHETADRLMVMEDLADRYGGVFHRQPCKICIVMQGMLTGLVTPWEFMDIHRGIHSSLDAMTPELLSLDLERAVPNVDVPVFFLLGRNDRHVEATLAATYFETLRAPAKHLIWFENSAHNLPFEEPERFNTTVVDILHEAGIL